MGFLGHPVLLLVGHLDLDLDGQPLDLSLTCPPVYEAAVAA